MGAQEISLPALLPREPYERTNRWTEYGDALFSGSRTARVPTTCSGPTHEELFALTVKGEYSSYKDLPGHAVPDEGKVATRSGRAGEFCAGASS